MWQPAAPPSRLWGRAAERRRPPLLHLIPPALVAVALAQAVLQRGGFSLTARVVFVLLAAAAATASLLGGDRRAAGNPLIGVLLGLATLGAVSSAWTVGLREDALTWALLPVGYALLAVAVMAAANAALMRTVVVAAICACAFASGIVGLLAAATFSEPGAFGINGAWRPAGTLEYPPALALLEVCALAGLLRALCAGGRVAAFAAAPAAVAGAVLGIAHSRTGIAMALTVAGAALIAPRFTTSAPRARAATAVLFVALAGVAAWAVLGGDVPASASPQSWRVAVVVGLCVLAPPAWMAFDRLSRPRPAALLACLAAVLIAAGSIGGLARNPVPGAKAGATPAGDSRQRARPTQSDFLHGRRRIWGASLSAIRRRPLEGHGASAYLAATRDLQRVRVTSYAHNLPLELAVELGIAGALLALALYLLVLRACWRARTAAGAWPLVVPVLAFLVANLVDWPWHIAGSGAVWAAALGAIVAAGVSPRVPEV